MTTVNPDDIRARLDLDHISDAAEHASRELTAGRPAAARLTPGDGTSYAVLIVEADWWAEGTHFAWTPGGRYVVALVGGLGRAYAWSGDPVHPSYAAEKWTGGHAWTGVVLAEFLTAVADRLAESP